MAGSRRGWTTGVFQSWKQQDLLSESGVRERRGAQDQKAERARDGVLGGPQGSGVLGAPLT